MTDPTPRPAPDQETRPLPELPATGASGVTLEALEARFHQQESRLETLERQVRWIEVQVRVQRGATAPEDP